MSYVWPFIMVHKEECQICSTRKNSYGLQGPHIIAPYADIPRFHHVQMCMIAQRYVITEKDSFAKWSISLALEERQCALGSLGMKTRRESFCVLHQTHQYKERAPILGVSKYGVFGSRTNGLPCAICSEEDTPPDAGRKGTSLLCVCIQFTLKSCSRRTSEVTKNISNLSMSMPLCT